VENKTAKRSTSTVLHDT